MKSNSFFKSKLALLLIFIMLLAGQAFALYMHYGKLDKLIFDHYYYPQIVSVRPIKTVRFGFINDVHSYNIGRSMFVGSLEPMKAFVSQMSTYQPDFVIENGDFIEGTKRGWNQAVADFNSINSIYNQIEFPKYHVLGNHDLRSFDRQQWLKLVGYEKAYYYFDMDNLRVIVLDGNYVPTKEGELEVKPRQQYIRGYVPQEQRDWLENLLKESTAYRKIVFLHQPPLDQTDQKMRKSSFSPRSDELREMFAKYHVRAVFSGHIEEAYHENIDGVDYFITPGFHKNEETLGQTSYVGVFSEVEISREVRMKMYYFDPESEQYKWFWLDESQPQRNETI